MSCSPRRHTVLLPRTKFRWNRTIDRWVMAKKAIFKMAAAAILNFQNFIGHVTVIRFNIWCRVPNFIKIGRFLTEIWRFNDFQNGGRLRFWILKICSFCHAALDDILFCFLIQNFAEIGQSIDELWPKKRFSRWRHYKNFKFWSRGCHRVQYLMQYTKFHKNWTIFHWDIDLTIFKMAAVRHLGF